MKKFTLLFIVLLSVLTRQAAFAQTPEASPNQPHPQIGNLKGISYQAVAIDENGKQIVGMDVAGKPLYQKNIGVRFSIVKGNSGPVLYQETHTALTDKYGLFSLVIGEGEVASAGQHTRLMDVPWIEADQWLQVEISTKNDGGYRLVSLQQFMSVPYSFYTNDIADNAITTWKIKDEAILADDIASGAVTTSEILDGTLLNEDIANATVDLTTKVTGVLPVPSGGTGASSLTENGLVIGKGTGPVQALGAAADGQIPIGVTGGIPALANLTAGPGITITNAAGSITIASTVSGINSNTAGTVPVGPVAAGETFVSGAIPVPGVDFGNIVVASYDQDLKGCVLSAYVVSPNNIKVAIFNGTGAVKNLGTGTLKVLVVQ